MSPQKDDRLAQALGRDLHRTADGIHGTPIGLGEVKSTAGRIRRRRRVAAGAAALAAVAILVPVGILGSNAWEATDDRAPAPAETPGEPITLDPDAPQGTDPQVAYLDGRTLIDASGAETELPADYSQVVPAGEEYLALRGSDAGTPDLDILDAQGNVVTTETGVGDSLVSSADGTVAAWIDANGVVQTRANGRTTALQEVEPQAQLVEIVGSGSCAEEDGGCRVFYNVRYGEEPARSVDSHGIDEALPGDISVLNAVSDDGVLAGAEAPFEANAARRCSVVYDEQASRRSFRTCDQVLGEVGPGAGFSPDGSRLLSFRPDRFDSYVAVDVLDAEDGSVQAHVELRPQQGQVVDAAWEDDEHLLVKVERSRTLGQVYRLFRVSLTDGSVEQALEPSEPSGGEIQPMLLIH